MANAIEGGVQRDPARIQVMYLIMLYILGSFCTALLQLTLPPLPIDVF